MKTIVALLLLLLPTHIFAQEECKAIIDDESRLSCFDVAFGVVEVSKESSVGMGEWSKRVDVSALTDDKNVFLSLDSTDSVRAQFGGSGPATIMLRCRENTTSLFLDLNGNFLSDIQGYGKVEYRIDQQNLSNVNMSVSTNNTALGLWRGNQAIPFIQKLLGNDQLIIRATPFNESAVTVTFDIRGIDEAVSELRETCNW